MANLGPNWAYNPPSRGHGWLSLVFLCISGTPNVHFEPKNPDFEVFSMIFLGVFPGFSMQSRFGSLGQRSLSTWSIASNLLGFTSSSPSISQRDNMSLRLASLARPLAALAPCTLYIPFLSLSPSKNPHPPTRAVRAAGRAVRAAGRPRLQGLVACGGPVAGSRTWNPYGIL